MGLSSLLWLHRGLPVSPGLLAWCMNTAAPRDGSAWPLISALYCELRLTELISHQLVVSWGTSRVGGLARAPRHPRRAPAPLRPAVPTTHRPGKTSELGSEPGFVSWARWLRASEGPLCPSHVWAPGRGRLSPRGCASKDSRGRGSSIHCFGVATPGVGQVLTHPVSGMCGFSLSLPQPRGGGVCLNPVYTGITLLLKLSDISLATRLVPGQGRAQTQGVRLQSLFHSQGQMGLQT